MTIRYLGRKLVTCIKPFPKYNKTTKERYTIYRLCESKTLGTVIDALSRQTSFSGRKPIVVMDAGIATDGNIKMLKEKGYGYLCVSRSTLKDYYADTDSTP